MFKTCDGKTSVLNSRSTALLVRKWTQSSDWTIVFRHFSYEQHFRKISCCSTEQLSYFLLGFFCRWPGFKSYFSTEDFKVISLAILWFLQLCKANQMHESHSQCVKVSSSEYISPAANTTTTILYFYFILFNGQYIIMNITHISDYRCRKNLSVILIY